MKPLARLHLPLVAAACLWAVPASAGQWLIDSSTVSGTAEADYSRPRNQYPLEEEAYVDNGSIEPANPAGTHGVQDLKAMDSFYWSDPRVKGNWLRAGAGNASELTSRGFSVTAKIQPKTMKFVFQWDRRYLYDQENGASYPDPTDNPPSQIRIMMRYRLAGSTWARAESYYLEEENITVNSNATASATVTLDGQSLTIPSSTCTSPDGQPESHSDQAVYRVIYTLPVDPAEERAELTLSSTATVLAHGGKNAAAYAEASASAEAQIIDHHIEGTGLEPSYAREGSPPTKIQHERADDGSMIVDSVVSLEVPGFWSAKPHLQAIQGLFANPKFAWSHSGDGRLTPSEEHWFQISANLRIIAPTLLFDVDPDAPLQALGRSTTFRNTVTDLSDANSPTLINSFTVNWHLPYENWRQYRTPTDLWEYPSLNFTGSNVALPGGSVHATWSYENPYWGLVQEGLAVGFSVAGNMVKDARWAGLFAAASVLAADIGPKPDDGYANFGECWEKDGSTFMPTRDDSLKDRYVMTPVLRLPYRVYWMEGDEYDSHGYLGPTRRAVERIVGNGNWVGIFERHDPPQDPITP